jgi:mono/diheme cytochrome c family protein
VLAGLATSHKIGILIMAGVFIAFALVSSFVLPRRWPDFPGKHLRAYLGLSVLITAAMLTTIIVLAKEPKEARANEIAGNAATHPVKPAPPSTTSTSAAPAAGDAAAGKALFNAQGCSACHTFTPAGSSASVGPNLDKLAADAQKANRGSVDQYATESIKDPGAYVVPGYPNGVMPTNFGQLGDKKIADLVAFITSKS